MSIETRTRARESEVTLAEKLAAGTQKYLATANQLTVAGETLTPAQVQTQINAFVTLLTAVIAAQTAVKATLEQERTKTPAMRAFITAFVAYVRATFGNQPDVLADFGLAPRKAKAPLTAEQQAAAKAKRKATREARGTIGKKKKLAIKGDVTGVIVTPVTEPKPANVAPNAASALPTGSR